MGSGSRWLLPPVRAGREPGRRHDGCRIAACGDRGCPRPARRIHKERALPCSLLAARRDGCTHTCVRIPARGGNGQSRCVPGCPPDTRCNPDRFMVPADRDYWTDHDGSGRVARTASNRPQTRIGIRHRLATGADHSDSRVRQSRRNGGRTDHAGRSLVLQIHAVPDSRCG